MSDGGLRLEIKRIIVSELNLRGRSPESIEDDAALFGDAGGQSGRGAANGQGERGPPGLGLDSLDALQLAMAIEERLGVRIPEGDEARSIFRSVRSIADHVARVKRA